MKDESVKAVKAREGLVKHVIHLLEIRGPGDVVRYHLTVEHVDDGGQVQLLGAYVYLRHIRGPFAIRGRGGEVPVYDVGRDAAGISPVGAVAHLADLALQAHLRHQALDRLVVDGKAPVAHLRRYAAVAVTPLVLMKDCPDHLLLTRIFVLCLQALDMIVEHGACHVP